MSEAKIYTQNTNLAFVADQVAGVDATLTFLISCLMGAETYTKFREMVMEGLKEVKITQTVDIEQFLDSFDSGYAILMREKPSPSDPYPDEIGPPDYLREDDGLPVIFKRKDDAFLNIPVGYGLVRLIDLKERNERKAEQKRNLN